MWLISVLAAFSKFESSLHSNSFWKEYVVLSHIFMTASSAPVHPSAGEKEAADWALIMKPEQPEDNVTSLTDALLRKLLLAEDPPENASPNQTKQSCNKLLDMSHTVETLSDSSLSSSSSCFSSCPPPEYWTDDYVEKRCGAQCCKACVWHVFFNTPVPDCVDCSYLTLCLMHRKPFSDMFDHNV